jgi:hypothetical protein
MRINLQPSGSLVTGMLVLAALAVSGCAMVRLYDQGKDTAAKDIKTQYGQVQLLTIVDTERKNLDALLQEELTVLREARRAGLDLDLLALIDSARPIGFAIATTLETHILSVENGQAKWTPTTAVGPVIKRANELAGGADGIAALRKVTLTAAKHESYAGRVRDRAEFIAELVGGRTPPTCDTDALDKALAAFVTSIPDDTTREMVKTNAEVYQKACGELRVGVGTGKIARAFGAAEEARGSVKVRRAETEKIGKALSEAMAAYDAAVEAVKAADTSATRENLKMAADTLKGALDGAAKGLTVLDIPIFSEAQIQAIDRILSAVASGQVNADQVAEPGLSRAAAVAAVVPSLQAAAETVRKARVPGVSDLLIEKEHQLLLRDYALRRTAFAEQRADLHEARYRALLLEADALVEEHDALCTFMEKQTERDTRLDCDTLRIDVKQPPDATVATLQECLFGIGRTAAASVVDQRLTGPACPLAITWSAGLESAKPEAKRQLYRAVSALVRRRAIAEVLRDEADIRLVDLAHQEAVTADEYAVRAWNSLIATPINQLAAFYGTGIKPAELADLIVKAVGLAAIGVGVNR